MSRLGEYVFFLFILVLVSYHESSAQAEEDSAGECQVLLCPEDCGVNGHCEESDNCSLTCRCNDGYSGIPPNCTANTCFPFCHITSQCLADFAGVTFCTCMDGYTGNGVICQQLTDQCIPACRRNEHCTLPREGNFLCRCDDGFRNSTGKCKTPSSVQPTEYTSDSSLVSTTDTILTTLMESGHPAESVAWVIIISAVVSVLLLCLLCSAGIVYWRMGSSGSGHTSTADTNTTRDQDYENSAFDGSRKHDQPKYERNIMNQDKDEDAAKYYDIGEPDPVACDRSYTNIARAKQFKSNDGVTAEDTRASGSDAYTYVDRQ